MCFGNGHETKAIYFCFDERNSYAFSVGEQKNNFEVKDSGKFVRRSRISVRAGREDRVRKKEQAQEENSAHGSLSKKQ